MIESPVVTKAGILLQSRINELAMCIAYPESSLMLGLPVFRSDKKEKVLESSVRFATMEVGHPELTVTGVAFSVSKRIILQGLTIYGGNDLSYNYKVTILAEAQVVAFSEGTFHQSDYYGGDSKYVNIIFKNPAKLEVR